MNERKVTELWIYPVKSLSGIRVPSVKVLLKGFEHDRRWMLIDQHNRFMTQREFPRMALIKLSFSEGNFIVRYDAYVTHLPSHYEGEAVRATIWNDTVDVYEVSKQHNQWFSDILTTRCRLVYFPEKNTRLINPKYAFNNEQVSLADGYPVLVAGESSLRDLNARLHQPVPMNRFRPNIVFSGGEPYEEDSWKHFSIGTTRFAGIKPSARCTIITTDQATADRGKEPLATLATYRQRDNNVYFGQNVMALAPGEITEGDEIVLE